MATVIRFSRHGTKKKPFFRIVVQDHHAPRDGRFIEKIGFFNPIEGDRSLTIARERLEYWLSTGAQLSDSVRNTLKLKFREWKSGGGLSDAPKPPPTSSKKKKVSDKEVVSKT